MQEPKQPRSRPARAIIAVAWLMFFTSFFLPATNVLEAAGTAPGTPLTGWQAFSATVLALHPLAVLAEPKILLFLAAPVINLAMIIVPLASLVAARAGLRAGPLLVPLAIVPFGFPDKALGDLYSGFYTWVASIALMAAGCIWLGLSDELRGYDRY
ncbi:MAG TPA: hypothetical protein VF175_01040 [Lacipirellula sp.]